MSETIELNLVQCCRWDKYSTSQLCAKLGMGNLAIFSIRVEWRTESNAFEKSKLIRCTKSLSCNNIEILWNRFIRAAVVEPVGRNANWSWNKYAQLGWLRIGYKNVRMMIFSRSLQSKEVTEIGRKSAQQFGATVWLINLWNRGYNTRVFMMFTVVFHFH